MDHLLKADGYFIVREEGGEYEWMPLEVWARECWNHPIFGLRIGSELIIWDRITNDFRSNIMPQQDAKAIHHTVDAHGLTSYEYACLKAVQDRIALPRRLVEMGLASMSVHLVGDVYTSVCERTALGDQALLEYETKHNHAANPVLKGTECDLAAETNGK